MTSRPQETQKPKIQQPENFQVGNTPDTSIATVKELGGPKGPEPTRFGDWERKGRCVDF